jgi:hypothetical protein
MFNVDQFSSPFGVTFPKVSHFIFLFYSPPPSCFVTNGFVGNFPEDFIYVVCCFCVLVGWLNAAVMMSCLTQN